MSDISDERIAHGLAAPHGPSDRSCVMPSKLRQRLIFPVVLLSLCPLALSSDLQRQDQLVWDFAEFVQEFSTKNWPKLVRFVGPETKIGFGGEMGFEDQCTVGRRISIRFPLGASVVLGWHRTADMRRLCAIENEVC